MSTLRANKRWSRQRDRDSGVALRLSAGRSADKTEH